MNQKKLSNVFVWGFLFLYLLVACISFCHAIQFFNIGNVQWMSIVLAFSFELGLALSLAAILLSEKNKSNTLPWALMIILCAVQVIGNVYSTFKYISLSGTDYYQYLAKPLLFFIEEVDENTIQVIISWIIGAILPIIALMMTDMVATNIKGDNSPEEVSSQMEDMLDEYHKENDSDEDDISDYVEDDSPLVKPNTHLQQSHKQQIKQQPATHPKITNKPKSTILNNIFNKPKVDENKRKAEQSYFREPETKK